MREVIGKKMKIITVTMNTYQVINDDEIIPSLLASDSHRGGGIAIVISESNRSLDGERIPEVRHAGSAE